MVTEKDKHKAHELVNEFADRDNMGRLRDAIAAALADQREAHAKRGFLVVKAMLESQNNYSPLQIAASVAAAVRSEGEGK